jgi:hypothetical protein
MDFQRLAVVAADRAVQHAAATLIESRNRVCDMGPGAALDASQARVTLVLRALDALKHAGLVRGGALIVFAVLATGCERIVYRDSPTAPAVTEPVPSAPPSFKFPQGIPDAEIVVIPGVPTLGDVVNAEMATMFPDCRVGDVRCNGMGYDPQSFFSVLNSRLRARGLWAGQHRDGQSDEIVVGRSCTTEWENFHAWDYNGSPLWSSTPSSPCAGHGCAGKGTSYRGNTLIPSIYCR